MLPAGSAQLEYVAVMAILAGALLHALCFTGIVDLREAQGQFLSRIRAGIQSVHEEGPSPTALVATGAAFIVLGAILLIFTQG